MSASRSSSGCGLGAAAAKSGDTTLAAIIQNQARKLTGKGHNG
jgi:hypothetical protein